MLHELHIRGLGVIDDALLPLGPGLTVVTGETGAGKTMVVTGLSLLFGGRADAARVRTGAAQASIDGRIACDPQSAAAQRVRDAGGDLDDDEVVLRRVVTAAGRSRAYVGGAPAPIAVLVDLADSLVAMHGQSDQLRLTRASAQRGALDRYAGIDGAEYRQAYAAWRAASEALRDRVGKAAELRRESDLLNHGLAEIAAVDPQPGEADDLAALAARLGHAEALTEAARVAHDALLGDNDDPAPATTDVSAILAAANRAVGAASEADPHLAALAGRLTELAVLAADLGQDFGAYAANLDADPARLEQVESRRAQLAAVIRKYCDEAEPSLAGVLRWAESARERLAAIDVSDEAIAELTANAQASAAAAARAALAISAGRRIAATKLADAIAAELRELAMPNATLTIDVTSRPPSSGTPLDVGAVDGEPVGATIDGIDDVTFSLQPHPGSPPVPLGRGASGGELSRVMLAVEVCLAATEPVPTMVFDEVDAGVGGRAAVEVGRRLARLAAERQVLVVTHLAQVAAFADHHVVVDKPTAPRGRKADPEGVTASDVRVVTGDARSAELARMLAGTDSATARKHAEELLATATAGKRGPHGGG